MALSPTASATNGLSHLSLDTPSFFSDELDITTPPHLHREEGKRLPESSASFTATEAFSEDDIAKIDAATTERLNLSRCGMAVLKVAISRFSALQVLNVQSSLITDGWLLGVRELRGTLSILDLSHCGMITEKGLAVVYSLDKLRELYMKGLNHEIHPAQLPNLEILDRSQSYINDTAVKKLVFARSLRILRLSACPEVTAEALIGLLSQNETIREIDVRGCKAIESNGNDQMLLARRIFKGLNVKTFLDDLKNFNPEIHPNLDLDVADHTVSAILRNFADFSLIEKLVPKKLFELLLNAAPSVFVLDLRGMEQHEANFAFLQKHFSTVLQVSFEMGQMNRELLQSIGSCFPHLQTLNIKGLKVGEKDGTLIFNDTHLAYLVNGFKAASLTTLNLDETRVTKEGIARVSDAPQLERLNTISINACPDFLLQTPIQKLPPNVTRLVIKNAVACNPADGFDVEQV